MCFVPKRQIINNITIVHEVLHSMRRLKKKKEKGKKRFMVLKFNLEKAYDKLSWDFGLDTLRQVRLPDSLMSVVMKCVTFASMGGFLFILRHQVWRPFVPLHLCFAYGKAYPQN